jgi:GT2 family glycosyltransferase
MTKNIAQDSVPKVTVIILNWNGKEDTLECLTSVKSISYINYNIIVVDNGSIDNSVSAIKSLFPEATLLETGKNLGFAEGNNVGIRYAMKTGADYIFLLNNDTVVDINILNALVSASKKKNDQGIFGAKIYYYDHPKTIWFAGGYWDTSQLTFSHSGIGIQDSEKFCVTQPCDYVCGCALFLSSNVIESVGLMDKKFFLTYEETDWCYRANKLGFPSYFVPEAKLWHKISVSFGGENSPLQEYFYMRNILFWGQKHLPLLVFLQLLAKCFKEISGWQTPPVFSLKSLYWNLSVVFKRLFYSSQDNLLLAKLYGMRDFLLGRLGDCPNKVRLLGKS